MGLLNDDDLWDSSGQRAMAAAFEGGAEIGECMVTTRAVAPGDSDGWHAAWTGLAQRMDAVGADALAHGRRTSAREAFLRAATYHRTAYTPFFRRPVDPRLSRSFAAADAAFTAFAALSERPMRPLEVPLGETPLPAFLCLVDDSGRPRPTVVQINGYDSTLHEMYVFNAPGFLRRGYNVLIVDGPGQGRPLIRDGVTMRPDWESVTGPVVDHALTHPETDPERLVLAGWSFGGFLAPRAAAFEPRVAALVADPGQWDVRDQLTPFLGPDGAPDPEKVGALEEKLTSPGADPMMRWKLLGRGPLVHGVTTLLDYLTEALRYVLSPVAAGIRCPTVVTAAEGDPTAAGAETLLAAVTHPRKALIRFLATEGAGGHCETLTRRVYQQRVGDWLDETLRGPP